MQRPALGQVPVTGDDICIKATATGITFLHERKLKQRYTGSKTCAIGINGEVWPKRDDYTKMQALKIPSRLISYQQDDKFYLDHEKYKEATTPKRKKKAGTPACLIFDETSKENDGLVPSDQPTSSHENLTSENNSGEFLAITAKTGRKKSYSVNKKEVRQRILSYINTAKGAKELYFWTVSFPEGTPDNTCYQAFNTWLTTMRTPQKDKFGKPLPAAMLRDYLWVAERQTGDRLTEDKEPTYTIHFHIAIPHFMPVGKANAAMRTILKNLAKKGLMPGAVTTKKYSYNGAPTKKLVTTNYLPCIAKYNGVHISRNKKTGKAINFALKRSSRALAGYLTKYITKNDAGVLDAEGKEIVPGFSHLAWHNSRGFSCLFTGVGFTVAEFRKKGFGMLLNRTRIFKMEFATFIPWLFGPPGELMEHLYNLNSYIQHILE
jgi:hypothetical protein